MQHTVSSTFTVPPLDVAESSPTFGPCAELPAATCVIGAHPDDEVIGAGSQLMSFSKGVFVVTTNGAVRSPPYPAGFTTAADYAAARRHEFESVLTTAGLDRVPRHMLDFVDQEASLNLVALTGRIAEILRDAVVEVVLTHPYEGGHPDHDATAFATYAALALLRRDGIKTPAHYEFTSYHASGNDLATFAFLPAPNVPVTTLDLNPQACERKLQLYNCYGSQAEVLRMFPIAIERFRPAPTYDFRAPPHAGPLFYDRFGIDMNSSRWCKLADQALRQLKL